MKHFTPAAPVTLHTRPRMGSARTSENFPSLAVSVYGEETLAPVLGFSYDSRHMNFWSADAYTAAWGFAAEKHRKQTVRDTKLPYIVHVGNVAMEVMTAIAGRGGIEKADLAVQCALLHDVVEDHWASLTEIRNKFGEAVADGVDALTKDAGLPTKIDRMRDSLKRIQAQPHAIWMVKLADRITNLQPPPKSWTPEKIAQYREEADEIHTALAPACPLLGPRLAEKIDAYPPKLE